MMTHKIFNRASLRAGAAPLALGMALVAAAPAFAQAASTAAAPATADAAPADQEIVVTGTRQTGIEVAESAAPIQVLDSNALRRVGQPDLVQAIAQNVPPFTAQAFGGDTANLTLSARLRGLSPNHALVLIDGKRRHTTSNLAVLGGPYQGGASADLNFIPVSAIERIEVLQDGAAAQYGTDAIAGVVNIILKKTPSGGQVGLTGGGYMDGGGDSGNVAANMGFGGAFMSLLMKPPPSRADHETGDPPPWVRSIREAIYPSYLAETAPFETFLVTHPGSYEHSIIDMAARGSQVFVPSWEGRPFCHPSILSQSY